MKIVLGFDGANSITEHNLKQADALGPAKEGKLEKFLDEIYAVDGGNV